MRHVLPLAVVALSAAPQALPPEPGRSGPRMSSIRSPEDLPDSRVGGPGAPRYQMNDVPHGALSFD